MSSTAIVTATKMLESLPEAAQEAAVDFLRSYIENLQDEIRWDSSFQKTRSQLRDAAQRARQEIAEGRALPMDYERL